MEQIIARSITGHKEALELLIAQKSKIITIAGFCVDALEEGGKIVFMGNGGSAADSQHLAAELVGRFKKNRKALPALALSVNTSILTAIGNDYSYDDVFSRQVEALVTSKDVVFGISTSGKSKNVINAINAAKAIGAKTVGFLGQDGGLLKPLVDIDFTINFKDTPRIQEMHILAGHIICEIIETSLYPDA
jgi:D-sedoheptulose 7-phosphate isomerase